MVQLFFGGDELPLSKPEGVIRFLGKQEKHWKERFSAYETAHSWFAARDCPPAIRTMLQADPTYADAKLLKAVFEKQTQLDDSGRGPSQTDVLAFLEIKSGLAVLGVEGKVNESFGQFISEWNDYSPTKLRRLAGLIERLGLEPSISIGSLRYQLFHRTAATLIEAERAGALETIMLVQSFSPNKAGFDDFQAFAAALDVPTIEPGKLSQPIRLRDVRLRIGWTINSMRADTA